MGAGADHNDNGGRAAIGWPPVELWGASLYGNPCRDCGFDWSLTAGEAITLVSGLPAEFSDALEGRRGNERHPELGWTSAGYVSHVTDNLRIWAERLAGAGRGEAVDVPGYDPDLLARARRYDEIASAAALWSLQGAVTAWIDALSSALDRHVVLRHAARGIQRAEDVARNNAHDAAHHLWDVRRILTHADHQRHIAT